MILVVAGGTGEYAIDMHNLNAGIAGIVLGIIGILFILGSGCSCWPGPRKGSLPGSSGGGFTSWSAARTA